MPTDDNEQWEPLNDVIDWIERVCKQQDLMIARAEREGDMDRSDRIRTRQEAYETVWKVCFDALRGRDVHALHSNGSTVEFINWDEERP